MKIFQLCEKIKDSRSILPSELMACNDTLVGVEIELENCTVSSEFINDRSNYWEAVGDSSLRDRGIEMRLRVPLGGHDVVLAMKEFDTLVSEIESTQGSQLTLSHRTSMHIHMDCRGLEPSELHKIVSMYACLESSLYTVAGKERYDNIYCPGFSSSMGQVDDICRLFGVAQREFLRVALDMTKYSGLNLRSLADFGSIEFRGHVATRDSSVILKWINALVTMRSSALKFRSAKELVNYGFSVSPDKFIIDTMGQEFCSDAILENHCRYSKNNMLNALDIVNMYVARQRAVRPERLGEANTNDVNLDSILLRTREILQQD